MISLGSVFLATLLLLDLALVIVVIRPVSKLSSAADEISKGNLQVPELPAAGSDEISQLAQSFNRMYVSLAKAIRMLESNSGAPKTGAKPETSGDRRARVSPRLRFRKAGAMNRSFSLRAPR